MENLNDFLRYAEAGTLEAHRLTAMIKGNSYTYNISSSEYNKLKAELLDGYRDLNIYVTYRLTSKNPISFIPNLAIRDKQLPKPRFENENKTVGHTDFCVVCHKKVSINDNQYIRVYGKDLCYCKDHKPRTINNRIAQMIAYCKKAPVQLVPEHWTPKDLQKLKATVRKYHFPIEIVGEVIRYGF